MIEELNSIFMEVKDAEPEFENVPDGEYLAIVTKAEQKTSKSEKPMVQFTFKITEGEYKDKYPLICKVVKDFRNNDYLTPTLNHLACSIYLFYITSFIFRQPYNVASTLNV